MPIFFKEKSLKVLLLQWLLAIHFQEDLNIEKYGLDFEMFWYDKKTLKLCFL